MAGARRDLPVAWLEAEWAINIGLLVHTAFIIGFVAIGVGLTVLLVKKKREARVGKDALVTLGAGAAVMFIGSAIMVYNLLQHLAML